MATTTLETQLFDRVPPHSIEAEQGVLGSMLLDNEAIGEIVQLLNDESFYQDRHQRIYRAIIEIYDAAKPVDPMILREELKRREELDDIGGTAYLVELEQAVPTAANAVYYARIVKEKAAARHLIHAATQIVRDSYAETQTAAELLDSAEKKIFQIAQDQMTGQTYQLAEILAMAFDRIDQRASQEGQIISGTPTGFTELDELTSGLQAGELVIIAARPSMGKTAFALNIAEHVAVDEGIGAFFVSLEQSKLELVERLLCSRARVDGHKLRTGRIGRTEIQSLTEACDVLRPAPLYIDDTPGRDLLQISANARRLMLRHEVRIVIIDYLQLVEPDNKRENRQEQIAAISRRLKNLARELKVPIIALAQLNRAVEAREGHRPRLADLRESGAIEQDADVVMMLHRDEVYNPDDSPGVAEVIVAKQRNGPIGSVKLAFLKNFMRFETLATIEEPFSSEPF